MLLALTTLLGIVVIGFCLLSPVIQMIWSTNDAKEQIKNNLDHVAIRESALQIVEIETDESGFVSRDRWPSPIAKSNPKYVRIVNGNVIIEYGGGFANYGIIVGDNIPDVDDSFRLLDGVYFYATE